MEVQFIDRNLARPGAPDDVLDTLTFALSRVAYVLFDVPTRATNGCGTDVDTVAKMLSVVALGQFTDGRRAVRVVPKYVSRQTRVMRQMAVLDEGTAFLRHAGLIGCRPFEKT